MYLLDTLQKMQDLIARHNLKIRTKLWFSLNLNGLIGFRWYCMIVNLVAQNDQF